MNIEIEITYEMFEIMKIFFEMSNEEEPDTWEKKFNALNIKYTENVLIKSPYFQP